MSDDGAAGLSRRGALAAGGASLAALAGCTGVFDRGGGDAPTYDAAALAATVDGDVPAAPTAFPVAVPESMVERHRRRAQELLDAVPERPEVPNGVVTAKLRDQRREVVESMASDRTDEGPLDRLRSWRRIRAEAANLRGAYRAATGDADPEAVAARRDDLRSDLYAFLDGWEYRGDDPVGALLVHRRVERLVDRCRDPLENWSTFPETPTDAVFRVGDIVGDLERAVAALTDAAALRDRYVGSGAPTQRTALATAADALDAAAVRETRSVHAHLDREGDPPFERDVEETPAAFLYDTATDLVAWRREERREARTRGHHATAVVAAGVTLAGVDALSAVVEAVRNGRYGRPEDASRAETARSRAETALDAAWGTDPVPVSAVLAAPAREELVWGVRRLRSEVDESPDGTVRATDVNWAVGSMAYAKHYARATPSAVERVVGTLRDADGA